MSVKSMFWMILITSLLGGGLTLLAIEPVGAAPTKTPAVEKTPAAKSTEVKPMAAASEKKMQEGKETTITGRVEDLRGFMTGVYASTDHAKCAADAIRTGQPAIVETSNGAVLLGEGAKNIYEKLAPYALQNAELKGKLIEKSGLKYLEVTSVEKSTASGKTIGNRMSHAFGKLFHRSAW